MLGTRNVPLRYGVGFDYAREAELNAAYEREEREHEIRMRQQNGAATD